jgi:hypothetical protein
MALLVEFGYDLPVLYKNDANRKSLAATDEVYDASYAGCQVKRRRSWLPNVVTVHFKITIHTVTAPGEQQILRDSGSVSKNLRLTGRFCSQYDQ